MTSLKKDAVSSIKGRGKERTTKKTDLISTRTFPISSQFLPPKITFGPQKFVEIVEMRQTYPKFKQYYCQRMSQRECSCLSHHQIRTANKNEHSHFSLAKITFGPQKLSKLSKCDKPTQKQNTTIVKDVRKVQPIFQSHSR